MRRTANIADLAMGRFRGRRDKNPAASYQLLMELESTQANKSVAQDRWRWPLAGVRTALVATLVISVVFVLFPGLDLWFSRLFYNPDYGFPASYVPVFAWLRWFSDALVWTTVAALVISLVAKLALPDRLSLVPPAAALFLGSTLLLAPMLLVNAFLKTVSGRPRPVEIFEFGGDMPFMPAWRFTDLCSHNCSFVSGEASTAIWLITFAFVVPIALRNRVAIVALVLATIFSINRIAFGGHFLSDVLLSWTMTLAIIATTYHFVYVKPLKELSNEALEQRLSRVGHWVRRGFGGRAEKQDPPQRTGSNYPEAPEPEEQPPILSADER